jgi:hypothetical protein
VRRQARDARERGSLAGGEHLAHPSAGDAHATGQFDPAANLCHLQKIPPFLGYQLGSGHPAFTGLLFYQPFQGAEMVARLVITNALHYQSGRQGVSAAMTRAGRFLPSCGN